MVLNENDWELIEACRQGDPEAFAVLFEAHRDKVYSIALRFSGDPATALDIAQEVFVKLLARIRDFRKGGEVLVDQRLPVRPGRESALTDLLRLEARDTVQKAVAGLSPEHRVVVVLRYTEELSYEEIAEVLNCSRGTVASRLNRAHKILERKLARFRNG